LRIQSLSTAARSVVRKTVPIRDLVQERVRARQVMRHVVWRLVRNLRGGFTVIAGDSLTRIASPGLASDERLGEKRGIGNDRCNRKVVAMPNPVFGKRGFIAARESVPLEIVFLEVRSIDVQHVVLPGARRKPLPGVRCVLGWVRAPVQPYRPFHL